MPICDSRPFGLCGTQDSDCRSWNNARKHVRGEKIQQQRQHRLQRKRRRPAAAPTKNDAPCSSSYGMMYNMHHLLPSLVAVVAVVVVVYQPLLFVSILLTPTFPRRIRVVPPSWWPLRTTHIRTATLIILILVLVLATVLKSCNTYYSKPGEYPSNWPPWRILGPSLCSGLPTKGCRRSRW